jgi:hypothetical protein
MEYESLRSLIEEILDKEDIEDDFYDNEELSETLAKEIMEAYGNGKLYSNPNQKKWIAEDKHKRLIRCES